MLSNINKIISNDSTTTKYIWQLSDYHTIESVFIKFPNYDSICVSTQVGCNLKCAFCATGIGGFVRNLTTNEIIEQIEGIFNDIGTINKDFKISFMGMGEPLYNLNSVVNVQKKLLRKYPQIRFSLSTVGIVPQIYKLLSITSDIQLQISLHASNDYLRSRIIPITKKYPIKEVLEASKKYALASKKLVRINYILFKGINDSDENIEELAKLFYKFPAYLKVSKFCAIDGINFQPVEDEKHKMFEIKCTQLGIKVKHFISKGIDISSGCGQLRSTVLMGKNVL